MSAKISVIVPVYKVEAYIHKCLDSILAQTHSDLEIILVDDGSPDKCGAVCDEYAARDGRITVIHQQNAGLSAARNAGLDIATGEYIGFVDSDDWIEPDMYEYLLQGLLTHKADIALCGRFVEAPSRTLILSHEKSLVLREGECLDELFKDELVRNYVWDKLYKRSVFDALRFPEGLNYEDVATTYKIFEAAQAVLCLPEPKYHYLQRDSSIVADRRLAALLHYIRALKLRYEELLPRRPEYTKTLTRHRVCAAIPVWAVCFSAGRAERRKYSRQLKEIAAFASEHLPEIEPPRHLGMTGRLILRLSTHACLPAYFAAGLIAQLYYLRHKHYLQ